MSSCFGQPCGIECPQEVHDETNRYMANFSAELTRKMMLRKMVFVLILMPALNGGLWEENVWKIPRMDLSSFQAFSLVRRLVFAIWRAMSCGGASALNCWGSPSWKRMIQLKRCKTVWATTFCEEIFCDQEGQLLHYSKHPAERVLTSAMKMKVARCRNLLRRSFRSERKELRNDKECS